MKKETSFYFLTPIFLLLVITVGFFANTKPGEALFVDSPSSLCMTAAARNESAVPVPGCVGHGGINWCKTTNTVLMAGAAVCMDGTQTGNGYSQQQIWIKVCSNSPIADYSQCTETVIRKQGYQLSPTSFIEAKIANCRNGVTTRIATYNNCIINNFGYDPVTKQKVPTATERAAQEVRDLAEQAAQKAAEAARREIQAALDAQCVSSQGENYISSGGRCICKGNLQQFGKECLDRNDKNNWQKICQSWHGEYCINTGTWIGPVCECEKGYSYNSSQQCVATSAAMVPVATSQMVAPVSQKPAVVQKVLPIIKPTVKTPTPENKTVATPAAPSVPVIVASTTTILKPVPAVGQQQPIQVVKQKNFVQRIWERLFGWF